MRRSIAAFRRPITRNELHFKRNILSYVKADHKKQIAAELREVFLTGQRAYSPSQTRQHFQKFAQRWGTHKHIQKLSQREELHYYFTYLDFDWHVQSMIYTTNWVERLNKSFRRSLKTRNALPSPQAALLLLSKVAVDQETVLLHIRFITLNLMTRYFHISSPKQGLGNLL